MERELPSPDLKLAVCAIMFRVDGYILAVSRRGQPDNLGLPGGKVDPGETPEQAIIREVREETGLKVLSLEPVFERPCIGKDTYRAICYVAEYSGVPQSVEEGISVKWITWERLLDPKGSFAEYNRQLYEHLVARGKL